MFDLIPTAVQSEMLVAAAALVIVLAVVIVRQASEIRSRRRAEESLRASSVQYRAVVEDQTELVSRSLPDTTLTFINDAYCRYLGKTSDQLTGTKFMDHIPEERRLQVRELLATLSPENPVIHVDQTVRRADGEMRLHAWSDRGVFDDEGRLLEILAVGRDIHDVAAAREAQRRSEEKFAKVFQSTPDSVVITRSSDGKIVEANDSFLRRMGADYEQVIGSRVSDWLQWEDPDLRDSYFNLLGSDRAGKGMEVRFRANDGTPLDVSLTGRLIEIDGEPCALSISHSLADRRRAESAIRQSEHQLRQVIDLVPQLIFARDAEGKILLVNQAAAAAYGRPVSELVGQHLADVQPDKSEVERFLKSDQAILESGHPQFVADQLFHDADGRALHIQTTKIPFTDAATGEPAVLGASVDITDSKAAEDALRASEARFSEIIDLAPDAVISIDRERRILMASKAVTAIFGYDPEELIGQPIEILLPERFRSGHGDLIEKFRASSDITRDMNRRGKVMGLRKEGTEFPAEASIGKIGDDGNSEFIVLLHDITEREQAEAELRQAQKMEAVGQLTGGVAHDFNNLLTVILGNLQLLERRIDDGPQTQRMITTAINAAQRGGDLTHRLLAFARRQPLDPRVTDLNRLVTETVALISRTIGENIIVSVEAMDGLWAGNIDPTQLQSALLNLAINAGHAMPSGGRLVIAMDNISIDAAMAGRLSDELAPGDYVAVSVRDEGLGMAPEVADRAFDPFFTTKGVGEGSGLGLSMVYGFARQSGGDARIESRQGRGTTVWLYLPRATEAEIAGPDPRPEKETHGTEAVLVVEDNSEVREIAVEHLLNRGYSVIEAVDGLDALRLLQTERNIDVLFTDIVLPKGLNGTELAATARRLRPRLKILLTSGNTRIDIGGEFSEGDGYAFLPKPYLGEELANTMRTLIEDQGIQA